jgi:RNA polymerase sigma-70 factor (ECF subfamily)
MAHALIDDASTRWALAARDGDLDALDNFIRAVQRDVRRYVTHLSADPHATDDLTQETFLRALRSLHRFEGRSSARTWLLAIARRTVADDLRRKAARPRISEQDWQRAAEHSQPRNIPGFEDRIALDELVGQLPRDRREVFVLTQLAGLPYAQTAAHLGRPVGTVRSQLSRARTTLTTLLTAA